MASNIPSKPPLLALLKLQPGLYLDHTMDKIPISDFINKELILYSMADNIRSIPSMVDGLKPGQRKVLFGSFKRNLIREIKVSGQLYASNYRSHNWEDTSENIPRTITVNRACTPPSSVSRKPLSDPTTSI